MGFDKDRFPGLQGDQFDCVICTEVVEDPQECLDCGSLFCKECIEGWLKKQQECPMRCKDVKRISTITRALKRLYSDLNVQCEYFNVCKRVIKIGDLDDHQKQCKLPNCKNFECCNNKAEGGQTFCGEQCNLFFSIRSAGGKKIVQGPQMPMYQQSNVNVGHRFRWSTVNRGQNIELTNDNLNVFLQESGYMFRTILGDQPLNGGEHYWELTADERTENELKIGVSTKLDFNLNTAFSDYEHGFSYYGLGQLRHNSNSTGAQYGQRFKKEGILGVYLNMDRGVLAFSLNGKNMGIAYDDPRLKVGPIFPAVSMLHCAGCKLDSSKPIPQIFRQ